MGEPLDLSRSFAIQFMSYLEQKEWLFRCFGIHLVKFVTDSYDQAPIRHDGQLVGELDDVDQQNDQSRKIAASMQPGCLVSRYARDNRGPTHQVEYSVSLPNADNSRPSLECSTQSDHALGNELISFWLILPSMPASPVGITAGERYRRTLSIHVSSKAKVPWIL